MMQILNTKDAESIVNFVNSNNNKTQYCMKPLLDNAILIRHMIFNSEMTHFGEIDDGKITKLNSIMMPASGSNSISCKILAMYMDKGAFSNTIQNLLQILNEDECSKLSITLSDTENGAFSNYLKDMGFEQEVEIKYPHLKKIYSYFLY